MRNKRRNAELHCLARNSFGTHEKRVNHYILGGILGEGSFGKVREALDSQKNTLCAIKIINKRNLQGIPGGEESVEKEVEILRKIQHINCLHLFDFFQDDEKGKLYIVCERVGGGSVHQLCERAPNQRLPFGQARGLFLQLLAALEYLHGMNIIHRDIKPENMLLTVEGVLKVSDFGSALQLDTDYSLPGAAKCKGSPAFQPPEIISKKDCVFSGTKIDIWAAGITLYIMCIGSFPFKGSSVSSLFENIANAQYNVPDWVDSSLVELLRSMLCRDYKNRWNIEQIKRHPWMNAKVKKEKPVPWVVIPTTFKESEHSCSCTIS